jgi:TusA-related sulfurtransferase
MGFDKVDRAIDLIGSYSPCPEIIVRNTLKEMEEKEVLQVLNTDQVAAEITIPHYCDLMGYPCKLERLGESLFEILIRKLEIDCGDRIVDATSDMSPLPEIRARDALKDLAHGESIGFLVSDEVAAKITIPSFCEKKEYEYEVLEKGVKLWLVVVRK